MNKVLKVSPPFTSCLMINSNASKRLPFPISTILSCFAVSFYFYTADRCDGCSSSPHQYIPSTVLSPQEICSLAQVSPRCSTPTWNAGQLSRAGQVTHTLFISISKSLTVTVHCANLLISSNILCFLKNKIRIFHSSMAIKERNMKTLKKRRAGGRFYLNQ